MWPFSSTKADAEYSLLETGSQKGNETITRNRGFIDRIRGYGLIISLVLMAFSGILGGFIGARLSAVPYDLLAPAGTINHPFHYNRPFGQPPSDESEFWWNRIFPTGGGIVQAPVFGDEPVGFAMWHQLHCLNTIRYEYYDFWNLAKNHSASASLEPNPKVQECFDYLRVSLMCHADTNVERFNQSTGKITPWDSDRKCRDVVNVLNWADHHGANHSKDDFL